MLDKKKEFVTVKELAEHLGVTKEAVYHWYREGKLPKPIYANIGIRKWERSVIERWLKKQKATA